MKKLSGLMCGLLLTVSSFAQGTAPATRTFMDDPFNHPMFATYIVITLLAVSIILVSIVVYYAVKLVKMLNEETDKARAQRLGIAYKPSPTWWDRFAQSMNASVPVEEEKNIEMDHSYDGIKELDNHLPPWWKWLFYGTIGWSVVYIIVFHFSNSLPLSTEEYNNEIAMAEQQAIQRKASQPAEAIDENTLAFSNDPVIIENGKNVFASNPCGSCHREDAGGNTIGPNLTDEYWIHGGDVKSVFTTIKNGAVDKGMPAWGKAMSAKDLRDLTFYIISLQGSNPANAKAPQGELFKQAPAAADSTKAQAKL
ncbi:MAG TPA: cbb3-type cytochrome c oxidase N-terminal domain-containing protein [Chryseosolibacter sp.]